MEENEQEWCHQRWMVIHPPWKVVLVKNREMKMRGKTPPLVHPQTKWWPLKTVRNRLNQKGVKTQVAMLSNGTVRALTPDEQEEIMLAELAEEEAADMERDVEQTRLDSFAAGKYRDWEQWTVSSAMDGRDVKCARVLVSVQGEGGRFVRDANFLIPLRDG